MKQFIIIAGNIATGKTTLANRLASQLNWRRELESVDDNPYLSDFYSDMTRWAFHLQFHFLSHRASQHRLAVHSDESIILDRSIYEDARVFAVALRRAGHLSDSDFQTYLRAYNAMISGLTPPTLLVYLTAPLSLLMSRIKGRARPFEANISEDYLALLHETYESWVSTVDFCPVLRIHIDKEDDLSIPIVISRISDQIIDTAAPLSPVF